MLSFDNLLEEVYLKNNCIYCGGTSEECTSNNYCDDRKSVANQFDDSMELTAEVNQLSVIVPIDLSALFRKRARG